MNISATDHTTAPNESIDAARARWRALVEAELKGAPFEKKLVTHTFDGLVIQPLYTRADTAGIEGLNQAPGAAPFLRGVRAMGYRSGRWEFAQALTAGTAAEFNAAVTADLMNGQTSVVLRPDAAARGGSDPDEAAAKDVGAGGVSLADVSDLMDALRGVELDGVPVHVDAGAEAIPFAALYLEMARQRGVGWTALRGSVTADPIGHGIERGASPEGMRARLNSLAGWTALAETYAPALRTVGVNVKRWGNAGATAPQELGFALATATEYVRALRGRGVAVNAAVRRVVFEFAVGPQFFTEVAKFRAWRPLWTRVATAFGAAPEAAAGAMVAAATGEWNKTLLDPQVNLLRATTEALSAVVGGCDRLHVAPFNEVTGETTDFSRRIARNVHTLLAEEFGLTETADVAGGSWYVEKLTDEVGRAAWAIFQDIESRGGMIAALAAGYPQELAAKAAGEKKEALARRRLGLVGTNLFPNLKEVPLARARPGAMAWKKGRAKEIAARRSDAAMAVPATSDWGTRFAAVLAAARRGATLGQLRRFTRENGVRGETIATVETPRAGEPFEQLRAASAEMARRTGVRPRVFLAKMGPPSQHKARADFAAGFFSVGGFEIVGKQSFVTALDAAAEAVASKAPVVVLCSTDETHAALVPEFAAAMRVAAPEVKIVLAGLPADPATVTAFRESCVDAFIHIRANVHDVLAGLLKNLGALR